MHVNGLIRCPAITGDKPRDGSAMLAMWGWRETPKGLAARNPLENSWRAAPPRNEN